MSAELAPKARPLQLCDENTTPPAAQNSEPKGKALTAHRTPRAEVLARGAMSCSAPIAVRFSLVTRAAAAAARKRGHVMLYAHAINDCRVVRLQLKWGGGTPKGTPSLGKIDRVRCAILALVPGAELLDIRMMKLNNWSIYHVELATREQAAAVIARHGEDWFGDGLPVEASLLGVDQEGRVKELARSRRVGGAAGMWKEERGVVVAAADFLPIVPAEVTVWRLAAEREQLLADQHELRLRVWRAEAAAVVAEAAVAAREPRRKVDCRLSTHGIADVGR